MDDAQDTEDRQYVVLADVSNALVKLHKEQFGRGPTKARSAFAGRDTLTCVLHEALLPAEKKMVELGDQNRVRDARASFQAATASDFIEAIEALVGRKVQAFASGIDPDNDVVFENFYFEPQASNEDGPVSSSR